MSLTIPTTATVSLDDIADAACRDPHDLIELLEALANEFATLAIDQVEEVGDRLKDGDNRTLRAFALWLHSQVKTTDAAL